ncbi:hypothetical protein GQ55_8G249900 [Panicum hallii var. hallii]|uniref:Uncharacterized protein n=1 Tax=Panicum hallii var. hallii TaxID=1504633 RepID=A0A2T7CQY0_9POAL|nr:hypothetical protein GQ55_8G249900 [Panicum hallii var. hallii]
MDAQPESAPGFLASRSTWMQPWSLRDDPSRSSVRPAAALPFSFWRRTAQMLRIGEELHKCRLLASVWQAIQCHAELCAVLTCCPRPWPVRRDLVSSPEKGPGRRGGKESTINSPGAAGLRQQWSTCGPCGAARALGPYTEAGARRRRRRAWCLVTAHARRAGGLHVSAAVQRREQLTPSGVPSGEASLLLNAGLSSVPCLLHLKF